MGLALPDSLFKVRNALSHEIRVVGGAVRDHVLGVACKDIDLATPARPEQVMQELRAAGFHVIETGLKHGTVTAVVDGDTYEVTTLRADVAKEGSRHAQVRFDVDWKEDAARRDFTINALSMDLDGTVHDYFEGLRDAQNRIVRFIGEPTSRIDEDPLRILRFFRFRDRLGDKHIGNVTFDAIQASAAKLEMISGERIWMEMSKILAGRHVRRIMREMASNGVLAHIGIHNPDIDRAGLVRAATKNPITVLAALLNHPQDAKNLHQRWKFSSSEYNLLSYLSPLKFNSGLKAMMLPQLKRIAVEKGRDVALETAALLSGPGIVIDKLTVWEIPRFPVRGGDLLTFGMTPGPAVGAKLRDLESLWHDSGYSLSRDDLLAQAQSTILP